MSGLHGSAESQPDEKPTMSSTQQSGASLRPDPVCSVLNVVVDYAMLPPTALEPVEYQRAQNEDTCQQVPQETNSDGTTLEKPPTLLVPVLRIFGPIVRRDTSADHRKPEQSACLYVHGAFPYLLARPRVAGPDGSLHPFRSSDQKYIDWDDEEAVRRVVPVLTTALEHSIVATSSFNAQDETSRHVQATSSIVRKISVVKGRGFYTYCPGPVAPFLKIEYYNPAERWRVKRALEQGLDVDELFHPDPRQYMTATGQGPVTSDEMGLLRFNCYEAHIPYTMQFFKDYNLAGLSYIHLQNPRFRNLPRHRRQTFALYKEETVDDRAMFLESNASSYLWPSMPPRQSQSTSLTPIPQQTFTPEDDHPSQPSTHRQVQTSIEDPDMDSVWHPPPARETVCDVELDVHVRDILNVLDILTEQQEENVHWRAVPSLRELWTEERQRMELLLPRTKENVEFTASVKTPKTAQPGTALAVQGMQKLLDSSESFLGREFERAALQIRDRHARAIENADDAWKRLSHKKNDSSSDVISSSLGDILTPNFSQALDALNNLSRIDETEGMDESADTFGDEFAKSLLESPSTAVDCSQDLNASFSQTSLSQSQSQQVRFDNATQAYYDNNVARTGASELELSQRIDRGEGIVDGPFYHIDDFLDPETLRPLETLEDEDSIDNEVEDGCGLKARYERIETELQVLATQTCQQGQTPYSDHSGTSETESVLSLQRRLGKNSGHADGSFLLLEDSSDDDMYTYNESIPPNACREPTSYRGSTPVTRSGEKRHRSVIGSGPSLEEEAKGHVANKRVAVEAYHQACMGSPDTKQFQNDKIGVKTQELSESQSKNALTHREEGEVSTVLVEQCTTSQRMQPIDGGLTSAALKGIGNQGGRLWVEGGGTLKAKMHHSQIEGMTNSGTKSVHLASPITVMSIETHVQCRTGRAGSSDAKKIAMIPNSERDMVFAVVYVFARDPGGGETLQILERGCIFVPVERELSGVGPDQKRETLQRFADSIKSAMPSHTMGKAAPLSVECVEDERKLLLRLSSKVVSKNPDMLLSWDPQGSGLGYLIERGLFVSDQLHDKSSNERKKEIDMARLMGRVREPAPKKSDETSDGKRGIWKGSGLGKDWDERVGPGVAAASIQGRLVFSTRKLVSEEVKHPNASYLQAVVASVLNRRIPFHDNFRLTQWYGSNRGRERWRVLFHKLTEATAGLLLIDALDMVGRAGEAARLSGVEFSQSFPGIRGSQYKVEGVLLRALKSLNSSERGSKLGRPVRSTSSSAETPLSAETKSQTQSPWKARRNAHLEGANQSRFVHDLSDREYFFFSPSLDDANRQEALEVQALTLEPESGHIEDPIVVCDFTALYPSLIIAYNLCFSTCAGQLEYHSTREAMCIEGRTTGKVGPMSYPEDRTATILKHHLKASSADGLKKNRVYVTPSRSIYVAESVVKGVLPQVLDEILSCRAMLKKAAKMYKNCGRNIPPAVLRQLEARQLALKYVANVTYGYTSATFSGRCSMPLLADTIVECARRTLKNAIDLANQWGQDKGGKWYGCRCVYGDTDSVFVRLPKRTVKEAFDFGEAFCKAVTKMNPPPVQLKLEKVYLGSILQTKKKYCGMMFESKNQKKPFFEAKGLETVRRDQCRLTQKILRNALVTLFTKGIAAVKPYLFRQWSLILSRSFPVADFILTGRVRSRYRGDGVGPVQAVLARRLAEYDPGRVVRHKERLAYVIVATPGVQFKLRDGVLTPMELLEQWDAYVLNTAYYITKHINPALDRCLSLAPHKADVASWYASCPKPRRRIHFWPTTVVGSNMTLPRFFGSSVCAVCGDSGEAQRDLKVSLCKICARDQLESLLSAMERLSCVQTEIQRVARTCSRCSLTYEDSSTYATIRSTGYPLKRSSGVATPLGNCSCIDCPLTYERHRLREDEIEAIELCTALHGNADE